MAHTEIGTIVPLIELLVGQAVPDAFRPHIEKIEHRDFFARGGIGHSQLNELLLTLGFDRVTLDFFEYLFDSRTKVVSYEDLYTGITNFRKHAMLLYGNVKFAFKTLGELHAPALAERLKAVSPIDKDAYIHRPLPLHEIVPIAANEAYYLGYIVDREITDRLRSDPDNQALLASKERLQEIRRIGRANHDAYLTYDHMDVYIATSMRERHEFLLVSGFVDRLFAHRLIEPLRLRWFDPTQAFCSDRIDKGLVEGLMVKRARCTIYHVQETDTLGKDSELAATLAQGKPVIAYVPRLTDREGFIREARVVAEQLYPDLPFEQVVIDFLRRYYPEGAWRDARVQRWVSRPDALDVPEALDLIFEKAQTMYDGRARTLGESHPLGLQVNLATGVANGVLVVRTIDECARLLESIILNTMEFDIEEAQTERGVSFRLKEGITGCVFRVVTGDHLLMNSFWNFYL
jgi:hypothetical protein